MAEPQQVDVAMIGGRGFVGGEIAGILDGHPDINLKTIGSRDPSSLGEAAMYGADVAQLTPEDMSTLAAGHDVVILAASNDANALYAGNAPDDLAVLDLGANFRVNPDWHYGMPEIDQVDELGIKRVSNPGCYATAAILALFPLRDLLDKDNPVFITGLSGYTGAGNSYRDPEGDARKKLETVKVMPYSIDSRHSHVPEIAASLGLSEDKVTFQPQIVDHPRGIILTIRAVLKGDFSAQQLMELIDHFYSTKPLVEVVDADIDSLQEVENQDVCSVGRLYVQKTDGNTTVTITSGLDNLRKGAAVQAVQNLNRMFGKDEMLGLR